MKKLLILAMAASLTACTPGSVKSPSSVANATYDAVGAADIAYIAASKTGAALVAAGQLDEAKRRKLDDTAYQALLTFRQVALAVRAGTQPQSAMSVAQSALLAAVAALSLVQN